MTGMTQTDNAPAVTGDPIVRTPLVFPVGRYTGEFHPSVGAPVQYRSLGIGRLAVTIDSEPAFLVWAAAHRPLDTTARTWDRAAVADTARSLGVAKPEPIMVEFFEDGLLVEIAPDAPDAADFARAHRVVPLMLPLGNSQADPLHYGIGLLGAAPVLRVSALVNEVWQWSGAADNLWAVCAAVAAAGAEAEVADQREHDPHVVLATFLTALPWLIGVNAACLDEARRS